MIYLTINGKLVDLYDNIDINWQWTSFRFQKELRQPYTTDFTIPKTHNNLELLNLTTPFGHDDFNSPSQPSKYEQEIRGQLYIQTQLMTVDIQVVEIEGDDIKICLFEKTFPFNLKHSKLNDYFVDNQNSIYRWYDNSPAIYPNEFLKYKYGMPYYKSLAQVHAVKPLRNLLNRIEFEEDINLPNISQNWMLLASKKIVCPQNLLQVIEITNLGTSLTDNLFEMNGGQHITNDMDFSGSNKMNFNRDTTVSFRIYYAYNKNTTTSSQQAVYLLVNGVVKKIVFTTPSGINILYGDGYIDFTYMFKKGDVLSFYCTNATKFASLSMIVKMEHRSYNIEDNDYKTELQYKDRLPRLTIKPNPNYTQYIYFDGGKYGNIQTEPLSFSYFGYYCNLPDIDLNKLFYSLQWLTGYKWKQEGKNIVFEGDKKIYADNVFVDKVIPASEKLAKNNYIRFADDDFTKPISNIYNAWLTEEVDLHSDIFEYFQDDIKQYTFKMEEYIKDVNNGQKIDDLSKYVSYNEIKAPVLFNWDGNKAELPTLYTFNLQELTKAREFDITVYDKNFIDTNSDYIVFNGQTYMIIEGTYDIKEEILQLKTILLYI